MTDTALPVYSIVVGVDYSEVSELALREAARLALLRAPSELHVMLATASAEGAALVGMADAGLSAALLAPLPVESSAPEASEGVQAFVQKTLSDMGNLLDASSIRWTTHVRDSDPAHALAELAAELSADLIVVGSHNRHGLERFLLGSVAESVVRLAPCPVWVVRPVAPHPHEPMSLAGRAGTEF